MAPSLARQREEQGRLFWVWLLTLPILLLMAAGRAFGTPWPDPTTQRIAMVVLAFPVIFVVGEPLLGDAATALRRRRMHAAVPIAALAMACYASGLLALVTPAPALGGVAALVIALYLSGRYFAGRY